MKIFELEIPALRYTDFFAEITAFLQAQENSKWRSIFTPNPEICLATLSDREFLDALLEADYLTSDGIGLYLAYQIQDNDYGKIINTLLFPYFLSKLFFSRYSLYQKYGERICGSDLTEDLLYFCEEKWIKIAILDPSFPNDVKKCEAQNNFWVNLKKVFPELLFDHYIYSENNAQEVFQNIAISEAQVLFSTLGMKTQELSVLEGLNKCTNLKLGLWVGSSFDYFIWFQKRAPESWRNAGFEWLYRIFTSPGKIKRFKRILRATIVFPITVIFHKQ